MEKQEQRRQPRLSEQLQLNKTKRDESSEKLNAHFAQIKRELETAGKGITTFYLRGDRALVLLLKMVKRFAEEGTPIEQMYEAILNVNGNGNGSTIS